MQDLQTTSDTAAQSSAASALRAGEGAMAARAISTLLLIFALVAPSDSRLQPARAVPHDHVDGRATATYEVSPKGDLKHIIAECDTD